MLTLAVHTLRGFTQTGRDINKEVALTPISPVYLPRCLQQNKIYLSTNMTYS